MEAVSKTTPESEIIGMYKTAHTMEAVGNQDDADRIFKHVSDALIMNFLVKIEAEMIAWTQEQIELNTKGNKND